VPPKWFAEGLIEHLGGTVANGVWGNGKVVFRRI
jgi:hypothetical protein